MPWHTDVLMFSLCSRASISVPDIAPGCQPPRPLFRIHLLGFVPGRLMSGRGRGGGGRLVLAAELLERLALGLRDEPGRHAAEQHEQRVYLQHVVHPGRFFTAWRRPAGSQSRDGTLADDGTDLARGCRDTVGRRSVACRENFAYRACQNRRGTRGKRGSSDNPPSSVPCSKHMVRQDRLTWDNKSCGVGAKVEKELSKNVDGQKSVGAVVFNVVVAETHNDE